MLDSILRNYNTVSDYVIENVILQVLQPAQIPTSPSNSVGSRGAMVKGGLAGGAAVCAVILLLTSLRDTVKNRRDMEEKIDAKCLGVICHEKKEDLTKKGLKRKSSRAVSMLVENPLRSFRFVSANHMLADSVARVMEHRGVKILLLTSVLENEGKSTVAANLALSLAQEGKDVMLVDCDFRKPALYKIFGMPKESVNNLLAALRAGGSVDNVVQRRKDSHLYTVFNRSAAAAKDIGSELDVLRELLRVCADKLQFVIVDTAPMSQVVETEELASLADASLLVVRRDAARTKSINDAIDALNQSGAPVLGSVFNDAPVGLAEKVRLYGYDARYEYGGYYGK